MRLDRLQNPPINRDLNAHLLERETQNLSPISQAAFLKNQKDLEALSQFFGGESGGNFGFSSADFTELFVRLKDFHIGFALSNHQQAYEAYKLCKNFCKISPILPDKTEGIILDLPHCDVYIIPYINQDLLTSNPISKLKSQILELNPQALLIIDISYALRDAIPLDFQLDEQSIFLCDGESLGFLRGYGLFLSPLKLCSLFPRVRYIDGFYEKFLQELQKSQAKQVKQVDEKVMFFEELKKILKDDLSLFAPIKHCAANTLPLRLKGIKARNLLQSLYLEKIFAINGQECLFGFSSPSFVLQEMGYTQSQARELLSLSFDHFEPNVAQKLAKHYQDLKNLEI